MLKSAVVAMTILGCNCEQNSCEYVRTADLELASIADCQARMRREIERTDASYPLIVAVCENRWQPPALETVAVNDTVAPVVESQPVGQPVERSFMVRVRDRYSNVMSTARDGVDGAADLVSVPADWLRRQIAAVETLEW
jgi:hypothetical protein